MTVGLQCFNEDGYMYFDTSAKNVYRLLGRLRSVWTSQNYNKSTLTIPSQYDDDNHLFVLELPSGVTQYGEMYVGAYYQGGSITFTVQNSDPAVPPPVPSLLVYTINPVNSVADTYGIQVFDEQGKTTFSAHSSTALLQIEDYVAASGMQHGIIGRGNAVMINGLSFSTVGRSPYYRIVASTFRTDGVQVKASSTTVHTVTRELYDYYQPNFSVATVYVPPIIVNNLN